jgi:5-(aminomethyl)-3-furanmethanol phosphate kinase
MRVVWKLGGSVLSRPEFRQRLTDWLRYWPDSESVWLVGGGVAADAVREWDRVHQLGDETSHNLALSAMDFNAELVCRLLPGAVLVRSGPELEEALARRCPAVLCAGDFVAWAEQESHERLPRSWQLTSDSLAAWSVRQIRAERLVLVKSIAVCAGTSLDELAREGVVDPLFPEFFGTGMELWAAEPGTVEPRQLTVRPVATTPKGL